MFYQILTAIRIRQSKLQSESETSTNLPLLHILLLTLVLLDKFIQYSLETIGIDLESWQHVLHRSFDQDAIDHAKTLAFPRQGRQCV